MAFESGDVNSQEVFLLSDGQPLSRQQICESALLNPLFQGTVGQKILKSLGPKKKTRQNEIERNFTEFFFIFVYIFYFLIAEFYFYDMEVVYRNYLYLN